MVNLNKSYDTIVIGAGNAGQGAAGELKKAGKSVAIIESHDVGGTCPNHGCVPKKILVAASETLDSIRRAAGHHITAATPSLDWSKLIERKRGLIGSMPDAMAKSLEDRGIDLYRGSAQFTGKNTVSVDGKNLTAESVVVATGSRPRPLSFPGAELITSSSGFLDMNKLPASAIFVGGGVIALEFAHVLARLGTTVTILEIAPTILGRFDQGAVTALTDFSTNILHIQLHTGVGIDSVERAPKSCLKVSFSKDGKNQTVTAEQVFHGAGRVPNFEGLHLAKAGITEEGGRVALDGLCSQENQKIWFAGDLLRTPQLSPVASAEGRTVGRLIAGQAVALPDYSFVPSAVYTTPVLARVGLTEEEAAAKGVEVDVKKTDMSGWLGAKTYLEDVAYAKVLVNKKNGTIAGAHLVGHGASETINFLSLAMEHAVPAESLRSRIYAYPTFTNDLRFVI